MRYNVELILYSDGGITLARTTVAQCPTVELAKFIRQKLESDDFYPILHEVMRAEYSITEVK